MPDISRKIHIFQNIDQMADYVIGKWSEISDRAIKDKGYFSVALSGGKTPVPIYTKLAVHTDLPWEKTHVFMVDERFVPYESDENNYHMISSTLLRHVNIAPRNIHPVITSDLSPQTSAVKYEEELISFCRAMRTSLPEFDLVLLGIGEDGHTASLFPGTPSLKESRHMAVAVVPPDRARKERITLTLPVINSAKNIMFLVTGRNKAEVIRQVIKGQDSALPAAMVKPRKGQIFFLLDESAASLLTAD